MDPDDYRRTSYETWEGHGAGLGAQARLHLGDLAGVGEWLVRELDAKPGDTLLELGAGPGDPGSRRPASASAAGLFQRISPLTWWRSLGAVVPSSGMGTLAIA